MVTCVLAETTKVKNSFINGKEKFKRILSCRFGGRRKAPLEDFPWRTSRFFVVSSAANSVGRMLQFTAFGSGPDANQAELVPSGFFCPQPWSLRRFEKHMGLS